FNIVTTVILLPFSNLLVKLAKKIIPDGKDKKGEDKSVWLDERLLSSPPLAASQCRQKAKGMAKISKTALSDALSVTLNYDKSLADKVEEAEQKLDTLEDNLATYMLKLSRESLTEEDSNTVSELLHTIGDFERIGDHAINIVTISKEMNESGLEFSEDAKADFVTLFAAITEISELAVNAYNKNDLSLASKVEPLEEVIDKLTAKIKHKHIERMQKGLCKPELGVHISNLLIYIERISDHYSNVAVIIIQTAHAKMYKHDYLNELRAERSEQFIENYNAYKHKYRLAEDK
ncbi:MAG: Na/Pi cotransporter family protein, partial [Ruminococcus sp.]|nr:Na/Pi cotransporter family protein [Ruminococcus sp.]